jgi:hypothetical protein
VFEATMMQGLCSQGCDAMSAFVRLDRQLEAMHHARRIEHHGHAELSGHQQARVAGVLTGCRFAYCAAHHRPRAVAVGLKVVRRGTHAVHVEIDGSIGWADDEHGGIAGCINQPWGHRQVAHALRAPLKADGRTLVYNPRDTVTCPFQHIPDEPGEPTLTLGGGQGPLHDSSGIL